MTDTDCMRRAIALSRKGVDAGGGPFGAVVVKDGVIIGEGSNLVAPSQDPTAHAEIVAIRNACKALGTHDLSGCVLYASCEPCPMCFAAILWARIDALFYANDRDDAKHIGFDDAAFHHELTLPLDKRRIPLRRILAHEALEVFRLWEEKADKIMY
jgi:tRNA(Arg) A34 adenosine deaminase TadA